MVAKTAVTPHQSHPDVSGQAAHRLAQKLSRPVHAMAVPTARRIPGNHVDLGQPCDKGTMTRFVSLPGVAHPPPLLMPALLQQGP